MTEDQKNADVLYLGTETGIFLSLDRGKSWRRLKANFPTVRVDEITLHPRDNAMLVATHGRAHLDPRSPRADSGVRGGAAAIGRREVVLGPARRCSGARRTTRTTSSGAISSSSARTRRPMP